ncbi:MAG: hypothetical protein KC635_25135, partial [Myxococcales bacterium]|nr:hypothetical protein [Myxococcales bacterium]
VLAALSSPRPARTPLGGASCAPDDVAGERSLCRGPDDVRVFEGDRLVWRRALPGTRDALFFERGGAVAVLVDERLHLLDGASGEPLAPPLPSRADNVLVRTGGRRGAVERWYGGFTWYRADSRVEVGDLCAGSALVAVALDAGDARWAASCADGALHLGALAGGARASYRTDLAPPSRSVAALAFVPGRDDLLAGTTRGLLTRVTPGVAGDRPLWSDGGSVREVIAAPDGRRAVATWDGSAPLVIDLVAGAPLGRLPGRGPYVVEWASDSALVAAGDERTRWDYAPVRPRALDVHDGVAAIATSLDGERVAVAHGAEVTLIDAALRRPLRGARWQDDLVKDVAFAPGSHDVIAFGFGRAAVARVAEAGDVSAIFPTETRLRRVAGLADGAVIGASYGRGFLLWRGEGPAVAIGDYTVNDLAASPDGHHLVALSRGDLLHATDPQRGGPIDRCGHEAAARAVTPLPEGSGMAVALPEEVVVRCAARGGPVYQTVRGADLVSVAAAGAWLAAGGRDGRVWLWRVGDAAPAAIFLDHRMRIDALAFDPGGAWLVAGDWRGHVAFFDTPRERRDGRADVAWGLAAERALGRVELEPSPR